MLIEKRYIYKKYINENKIDIKIKYIQKQIYIVKWLYKTNTIYKIKKAKNKIYIKINIYNIRII